MIKLNTHKLEIPEKFIFKNCCDFENVIYLSHANRL